MPGTMVGMPETSLVTTAIDDRVAIITLDSPANRNALSRRLLDELIAALAAAGADDTLHAVLLTSSQPVFSAGADLKEAAHIDMVEQARRIIAVQRAIVACPVPVVARLDGPVRAGGLGLVASADIVIAGADVTLALTEVRLGLAAATISIPLMHRLSSRAAADWFLTGRSFTAAEAREHGLITHTAAPADLDALQASVLADLRHGIPQGLRAAKALLTADLLAALDDRGEAMAQLSGALFHSPLAQAAMAAAVHRR